MAIGVNSGSSKVDSCFKRSVRDQLTRGCKYCSTWKKGRKKKDGEHSKVLLHRVKNILEVLFIFISLPARLLMLVSLYIYIVCACMCFCTHIVPFTTHPCPTLSMTSRKTGRWSTRSVHMPGQAVPIPQKTKTTLGLRNTGVGSVSLTTTKQ